MRKIIYVQKYTDVCVCVVEKRVREGWGISIRTA